MECNYWFCTEYTVILYIPYTHSNSHIYSKSNQLN